MSVMHSSRLAASVTVCRRSLQPRDKGAQHDRCGRARLDASQIGIRTRVVNAGGSSHALCGAASGHPTRAASSARSAQQNTRATSAAAEGRTVERSARCTRRTPQRSRPTGGLGAQRTSSISSRTTSCDQHSTVSNRHPHRSVRLSPHTFTTGF